MKVLIAGAGGQVGRSLVASAPAGAEVVAFDRSGLDVTDADAVRTRVADLRPDLIINSAAYTAVDRAESEPELARKVNEGGARNIAVAAAAANVRVLHVSTDFVFDGRSSTPYAPDAEPRPLSVYGKTKLDGERAIRKLLPGRSLILRTAWIYAAEGTNFVLTMLRLMRERASVDVIVDQIGTPTAADSVAHILWSLASQSGVSGIYHWTDEGVASWYDFAVAISQEGGDLGLIPQGVEVRAIGTEDYPLPAERPRFSVLDKRATTAVTGIEPRHWRDNLRRTLRKVAATQA